MQLYSDYFKTLHDETGPTGYLGRGTHYSVLRAVVFHDPMGKPLPEGHFTNFAIIWDEDHDARVMEPIEEIYRRGLLSSFLMFGERKGTFTAVLSNTHFGASEASPHNPAMFEQIDALNLSSRSFNILHSGDCVYIGDVVQKSEAELYRWPNVGRKALAEIKDTLAQLGVHLGMELPNWPPENLESLAKERKRVAFLWTEINAICQSLGDPWTANVVSLESAGNPIIYDEDERVSLYLKNLEQLWRLGTVATRSQKPTLGLGTEPPLSGPS